MLLIGRKVRSPEELAEGLQRELEERIWKEKNIRELKRAGIGCPYASDYTCSKPTIRCGERQQYSTQREEELLEHRCNYDPGSKDKHVLIVDDENTIRVMCADLFEMLGFKEENIQTASCVPEAKDILKQGKIENRQYAFVLSDINMPGGTGYDLVTFLTEGNYNSRIMLMTVHPNPEKFTPPNYMGDQEVIPGEKVVSRFFRKKDHDLLKESIRQEIEKMEASYQKAP